MRPEDDDNDDNLHQNDEGADDWDGSDGPMVHSDYKAPDLSVEG